MKVEFISRQKRNVILWLYMELNNQPVQAKTADYRVYLGIGMVALVAIYYMASYVVPRTLVTLTKAAPATVVSLADSRIIGEKILALADGKDQASVNVFVLDKTSKGVRGKQVELTGADSISPSVAMTDAEGKANFKITSAVAKQYTLVAAVEGAMLSQRVVVTFRN